MNECPLVSVVVITYNSSKYVLEALESAKAQTYQNIELIVSDDCSTDDTVQICREWIDENKDRFVRTELITVEKNTGISPNCNRGYSAAKGEWIKGVAGDDFLFPNCVECYVQYIKEHADKKILFSKIRIVETSQFSDLLFAESNSEAFWKESYKIFESLATVHEQYQYLVKKGNFISATTGFINTAVWTKLGKFDEAILFLEDYPFWIKATKRGYVLTLLPEVLCGYRISNDSIRDSGMSKFRISGNLFAHKYIYHTPLCSFFIHYIDQFNTSKSITSIFFMKILDILALPIRICRKLHKIL